MYVIHEWGDDWFENNGKDLYDAIAFIQDYLHKHHIGICGKEKYGTYRDEHLRFWEGGLYQILFGNRLYIGTSHTYEVKEKDIIGWDETSFIKKPIYNEHTWRHKFNQKISPKLVRIANKIHQFIYYKIDEAIPYIPLNTPAEEFDKYYKKKIWHGLIDLNWRIGLTQFVQKIQAKYYNYAFQLACKKWPHIQVELICETYGYKMIKPCKYGDIDGEKIISM